jgi:hypothetical protein
MTSESTRPSRGRVHSSTKRQRADATGLARRPPSARLSRTRELENQVQQLKQQLHEQEIQNLLDLRQALGLVGEKERSKSAENLSRIPTTALRLLKTDLVKILTKVNGLTLPSPTSTETVRGDEPYIA